MITTPQGFDLQGQEPLEGKTVQPDAASRIAITTATTYDGLTVYQSDMNKTYQWQGTPAAGAWLELILDGYPTTSFINVSAGAVDSGKPIVLDATGKIDTSMLSASDLSLYYLLDGTRPLTGTMNADGNTITGLPVSAGATEAVRQSELSAYLLTSGTAANSTLFGGNNAAYYTNASNLSTGTLDNGLLPAIMTGLTSVTATTFIGNLTGNADTATTADSAAIWTTARSITLTGDVTGTVAGVDGSANIEIATTSTPASHTHDVGAITGTVDVFDRSWGTTVGTVAQGNHAHSELTVGDGLQFAIGTSYIGTTARDISVNFGSGATQAATGDHTHTAETWQTTAYKTGFTAYTIGDYNGLKYRILNSGLLEITGAYNRAGDVIDHVIELTVTYRPDTETRFPVSTDSGASYLRYGTNGRLYDPNYGSSGTVYVNVLLPLDN